MKLTSWVLSGIKQIIDKYHGKHCKIQDHISELLSEILITTHPLAYHLVVIVRVLSGFRNFHQK